jgi:low temperature requirement protein LtrA
MLKKASTLSTVAFRVATWLSVIKTLWIAGLISGRDIKLSGLIFAVNYRGREMVLDIPKIRTIF